jgi:hypothetical protein
MKVPICIWEPDVVRVFGTALRFLIIGIHGSQ